MRTCFEMVDENYYRLFSSRFTGSELSAETREFIRTHRNDDVRRLALGNYLQGVDMRAALVQIAGRQAASVKLPEWAANDDVIWPEHISMEQCTSQRLAQFKSDEILQNIILKYPAGVSAKDSEMGGYNARYSSENGRMADLTGGFGVDCFYLSRHFNEVLYNELNPELCKLAACNFPVLGGCTNLKVSNMTAETFLKENADKHFDLMYIDPARRAEGGRKLVSLRDCQPDVTAIQRDMLAMSDTVMVKMSPMLDVRVALSELACVRELWILSLDGECKELLAVMQNGWDSPTRISAVDITSDGNVRDILSSTSAADIELPLPLVRQDEPLDGTYLYEPFASYMKSGLYRTLCSRYGVRQLHPNSHLFLSAGHIAGFPGRAFRITSVVPADKHSAKRLFTDYPKANISVRNFPMTPDEIRTRYRVRDGGNCFIFATTTLPDRRVLLLCERVL